MTLPAAQQRALDGMAEAMRASEPRLVSMFAMFTRLTGNEVAPGREQLPRRPMRDFLGVLAFWRPVGATGRPRSALWRRTLLLVQLAAGVALFGLLIGMSSGSPARCHLSSQGVRATARGAYGTRCPVQAGAVLAQPAGK
jgi:hypothetical protein